MAKALDTEMVGVVDLGPLKAKILAALDKGDYKVEYGLPGNVSFKKRADGTEYYVIEPSGATSAPDLGSVTVSVCGIEFTHFNDEQEQLACGWNCSENDLSDDEDICEKLRFLDDVYVSDSGDEDAIRQICICHSGRTGSEVEIYLSDDEDLPDEEEEGTEASGVQAVGGIGAGKRKIGDNEYERDAALEHISIAEGVEWIGDMAFYSCRNLKSVTIPSSVKRIGACAFGECQNLAVVNFGEGLETISNRAFDGCRALNEVKLPSSVSAIGGAAFRDCTSLIRFSFPDRIKTISHAVLCDCKALLHVEIPEGVTVIERAAFIGCTNLKEITIPSSVECIQRNAFAECTSLESIKIPASVQEIGSCAFEGCTTLRNVTIEYGALKKPCESGECERVFWGCINLERVALPCYCDYKANKWFGDALPHEIVLLDDSAEKIKTC